MVRWFKIFGDQYIGFWILGLILFALQEIPYMVMPLFHLENNPIMNMQESSAALNLCEKVLGSLCVAVMTFIIVLLPPLYYVFIGLWRENWILLITGILFEAVHFSHVYGNLKM